LALLGSFGGVRSGFEIRFLDEVSPAFVTIRGILEILEFLQLRFRVLLAHDYSHHPIGAIGTDVMPDDDVGSGKVVVCQRGSVRSSLKDQAVEISKGDFHGNRLSLLHQT
jgi:hypothetical protein